LYIVYTPSYWGGHKVRCPPEKSPEDGVSREMERIIDNSDKTSVIGPYEPAILMKEYIHLSLGAVYPVEAFLRTKTDDQF
jgi:hypothetical protein